MWIAPQLATHTHARTHAHAHTHPPNHTHAHAHAHTQTLGPLPHTHLKVRIVGVADLEEGELWVAGLILPDALQERLPVLGHILRRLIDDVWEGKVNEMRPSTIRIYILRFSRKRSKMRTRCGEPGEIIKPL